MRYGSICSGIEAAAVAWHGLGWRANFFSEIEQFPRDVLKHHYPSVPLHGDFTTIKEKSYDTIDLLVGGTPCQAFSVAGLRKGFGDERGNLSLEFIRLCQRLQPRWVVWENVPGVLSIDRGRAFATFLAGLGQCGYGFAYRVLNAQYFGVPQCRRRVFVIANLGSWQRAAAVLFERENMQWPIETCEGEEKEIVGTFTKWAYSGGPSSKPDVAASGLFIHEKNGVRRFTPIEVERLFGFPDNYTRINEKTSDLQRYQALGNSMAVPVMRWLGERIKMVDSL